MQDIDSVRSPSIIRENVDRGLNRVITDDDLDESLNESDGVKKYPYGRCKDNDCKDCEDTEDDSLDLQQFIDGCETPKKRQKHPQNPRWRTKEGYQRLKSECAKRSCRLEMTLDQWLLAGIHSTSKVPIRCITHNVLVQTTHISNFCTKGSLGCGGCSAKVNKWNTPNGFKRFNKLCAERNCRINLTLEEWLTTVSNNTSTVTVICIKHGIEVQNTSIRSFLSGVLCCSGCSSFNFVTPTILTPGFSIELNQNEYRVIGYGIQNTYASRDGKFIAFNPTNQRFRLLKTRYGAQHGQQDRLFVRVRHSDGHDISHCQVLKAVGLAWDADATHKAKKLLESITDIREIGKHIHADHVDGDNTNNALSNCRFMLIQEHRDKPNIGKRRSKKYETTFVVTSSNDAQFERHFSTTKLVAEAFGVTLAKIRDTIRNERQIRSKNVDFPGLCTVKRYDPILPGEIFLPVDYEFLGIQIPKDGKRTHISNMGRLRTLQGRIRDLSNKRLPQVKIGSKMLRFCNVLSLTHNRQQAESKMVELFGSVSYENFRFLRACHGEKGGLVNTASNLRLDSQAANMAEEGIPVYVWKCDTELDLTTTGNHWFQSSAKAARVLGLQGSSICMVCKGHLKQTGGYYAQYVNI